MQLCIFSIIPFYKWRNGSLEWLNDFINIRYVEVREFEPRPSDSKKCELDNHEWNKRAPIIFKTQQSKLDYNA